MKEFYKGDFVSERLKGGFDRDLALMMSQPHVAKLLTTKMPHGEKMVKLSRMIKNDVGMGLVKVGDIGAFLAGKSIYTRTKKAVYDKLIEEGKSKEVAEETARKEAAEMVASIGEKTQQSKYPENMSYYQLGKTSRLFRYMTTKIQYQQQIAKGIRNISRGQGTIKDARRIFNYGVAQPYIYAQLGKILYSMMRNGNEDEDIKKFDDGDFEKVGKTVELLSNSIQGVPVLYDALQFLSAQMQGKKTFRYRVSSGIDRANETTTLILGVFDLITDDDGQIKTEWSEKDQKKIKKTLVKLGGVTGIGVENAEKFVNRLVYGDSKGEEKKKSTRE